MLKAHDSVDKEASPSPRQPISWRLSDTGGLCPGCLWQRGDRRMTTRVLIVGAGAIGGVTAARLSSAGCNITVLDAHAEHVRLMCSPGLRFDELGTESQIVIDAVSSADQLTGTFDYALVYLKAPFIEVALAPLLERNLATNYVSFGNGLVQQSVTDVVGPERLIIGIVEWGATNLGPGHVRQTTVAPFVIGEVDGTITDRLVKLGEVLENAADVRLSSAIYGQVWAKLLLNSTFSGLGAITGMVYADVMEQPDGHDIAFAMWTEGHAVATALGIELDDVAGVHADRLVVRRPENVPQAEEALTQLMARLGPTKASMLQDLERGASTEVDVINGGVVREAHDVGLPAPLNQCIVDIVHACEAGTRTPGPDNLDDLRALLNQTHTH